jgi:hypothetical protein
MSNEKGASLREFARMMPPQRANDGTEVDASNWLSGGEVAGELGISTVAVRQAALANALRFITTPGGRLFDPASVEQYKRQRAMRLAGRRGVVGASGPAGDPAPHVCPHCGGHLTGVRG